VQCCDAVSKHVIENSQYTIPPLDAKRKAEEVGNRVPIAAHHYYDMEVGRAATFMARRTRRMRLRHALNAE
jgi:hypothetical protein